MSEDLTDGALSMIMVRHKIVFVGDVSVGKTSTLTRFTENQFNDTYDPTIGIDFFTKFINFRENSIRLQIWDSAGQERYKSLIPSYLKGASIIFLVYDISKKETFANIARWMEFVSEHKNECCNVVLCGNKLDLERQVGFSQAEKFAKEQKILFFEISAKTGDGIENMFFSAIADLPYFAQFEWQNKEKLVDELLSVNKGTEQEKFPNDISRVLNIQNMNIILNKKEKNKSGGCSC